MIHGYSVNEHRIIKQDITEKFKYDQEYITNGYGSIPDKVVNMAHLRLGVLGGIIGDLKSPSILEVGYGNGAFLSVCQQSKLFSKVYGFDINGIDVPMGCEFINDIYSKPFDIVCFFDSLEHFQNIYDIKNLKSKYVYISLPNCHNGLDDEWFTNWKHRKPNEHLWHFNKDSLSTFMTSIGYDTMFMSNIEDSIRQSSVESHNILTGMFVNASY